MLAVLLESCLSDAGTEGGWADGGIPDDLFLDGERSGGSVVHGPA